MQNLFGGPSREFALIDHSDETPLCGERGIAAWPCINLVLKQRRQWAMGQGFGIKVCP